MNHEYTLFDALDEATLVNINGCEAKVSGAAVSGVRTLVFKSNTGREEAAKFEDQRILLDNEGRGHAFDAEHCNPWLQFRRHVAVPLPFLPIPQVQPPKVQELLTSCLTAMRNVFDDEQWREMGVSLDELLDQARALGVTVR